MITLTKPYHMKTNLNGVSLMQEIRKVEGLEEIILHEGVFLCGGFIRRWFNGLSMDGADVDLFFNHPTTAKDVRDYLSVSCGYKTVFDCPEGKLTTLVKDKSKVQIITMQFFPDVPTILNTFDFTVTMYGYDSRDGLYVDERAVEDDKEKVIKINKLTYPMATFRRILKYSSQGYYCPEEALAYITASIASGRDANTGEQITPENLYVWYVD